MNSSFSNIQTYTVFVKRMYIATTEGAISKQEKKKCREFSESVCLYVTVDQLMYGTLQMGKVWPSCSMSTGTIG